MILLLLASARNRNVVEYVCTVDAVEYVCTVDAVVSGTVGREVSKRKTEKKSLIDRRMGRIPDLLFLLLKPFSIIFATHSI